MRTILTFTIFLFILLFLGIERASAQNLRGAYFLNGYPYRHNLNPAFQPEAKGYFGIGFSSLAISAGNNSFAFSDIFIPGENGLELSLSNTADKDRLFKKIKPNTFVEGNLFMNILSVGWRAKKSFWTVDVNARGGVRATIPRDFFRFGFYLLPEGTSLDISGMGMRINSFAEIALGYSRRQSDKLSFGFKVKYLAGLANFYATYTDAKIYSTATSVDPATGDINRSQIGIHTQGKIQSSLPGVEIRPGDEMTDILDRAEDFSASDLLTPAGHGVAFDLGAEYKPIKNLSVSASVNDLGFIMWNKSASQATINGSTVFDGGSYDVTTGEIDWEEIEESLKKSTKIDQVEESGYTQMLSARVNVGVQYSLLKDIFGFGLLSTTTFSQGKVYEELTPSVNIRPSYWFSTSFSYSVCGGAGAMGWAMNFKPGPVNIFIGGDYIPFHYSPQGLPFNVKRSNIQFGINFVFGAKKYAKSIR